MRVAYQYTSHVFPFRCARVKTLSFSPFVHVFSHYKKILILKLYLFLNSSLSLSLSAKLFGRYYNLVLYRVSSSSSSSSSSMLLRRLRRWFYLCTPRRMRRKRMRRKRVPIAVSAMLLRIPFQQKHHHKRTKR